MRKHLIAAALLASVAMPAAASASEALYLEAAKEDCLNKAAKALQPQVRKHKIDWKLFVASPKLTCNISLTDDHEIESANAVLTEWWEAFGGAYSQEVK
jgi:hypothetical protein